MYLYIIHAYLLDLQYSFDTLHQFGIVYTIDHIIMRKLFFTPQHESFLYLLMLDKHDSPLIELGGYFKCLYHYF